MDNSDLIAYGVLGLGLFIIFLSGLAKTINHYNRERFNHLNWRNNEKTDTGTEDCDCHGHSRID